MKTIIDTLKEIIKKDASTQTDPVTILENEEEMSKVIIVRNHPRATIHFGEKEERDIIRKKQKIDDDNEKKILMSGIEHTNKESEMKEKEQGKLDKSFYDKCKAYLNNIDPVNDTYYSLKQVIENFIKDEVDLNSYITNNIFVTNSECYEEPEEASDVLKSITAAMYMILEEKKIDLSIGNNLRDAIHTDLRNAVGVDMSGEIINFLDHYEG